MNRTNVGICMIVQPVVKILFSETSDNRLMKMDSVILLAAMKADTASQEPRRVPERTLPSVGKAQCGGLCRSNWYRQCIGKTLARLRCVYLLHWTSPGLASEEQS